MSETFYFPEGKTHIKKYKTAFKSRQHPQEGIGSATSESS
jgi:hypothetical protein